jgi:hypothetical protein
LQSQQVRKKISTHFAKPKLEQKHNSFYAKSSKVLNYIITMPQNKKIAKKYPLNFPKKKLQVYQKTMGILKNPPKLQVIQPYPPSRTWN